jgi:hypothetical protein
MEATAALCARYVRSLPIRLVCCVLAALVVVVGACFYAGAYWLEGRGHAA